MAFRVAIGLEIMPLGANAATHAAGSPAVVPIVQHLRRGRRGKTVPLRYQEPISRDA